MLSSSPHEGLQEMMMGIWTDLLVDKTEYHYSHTHTHCVYHLLKFPRVSINKHLLNLYQLAQSSFFLIIVYSQYKLKPCISIQKALKKILTTYSAKTTKNITISLLVRPNKLQNHLPGQWFSTPGLTLLYNVKMIQYTNQKLSNNIRNVHD